MYVSAAKVAASSISEGWRMPRAAASVSGNSRNRPPGVGSLGWGMLPEPRSGTPAVSPELAAIGGAGILASAPRSLFPLPQNEIWRRRGIPATMDLRIVSPHRRGRSSWMPRPPSHIAPSR